MYLQTSLLVLSAKVTGLFAEIEGASFQRHIVSVLELVDEHTSPEKYKQVKNSFVTVTAFFVNASNDCNT
jgi:hypothetical protein